MCEELLQLNRNETVNNTLTNGQRTQTDIFPKKRHWSTHTREDADITNHCRNSNRNHGETPLRLREDGCWKPEHSRCWQGGRGIRPDRCGGGSGRGRRLRSGQGGRDAPLWEASGWARWLLRALTRHSPGRAAAPWPPPSSWSRPPGGCARSSRSGRRVSGSRGAEGSRQEEPRGHGEAGEPLY